MESIMQSSVKEIRMSNRYFSAFFSLCNCHILLVLRSHSIYRRQLIMNDEPTRSRFNWLYLTACKITATMFHRPSPAQRRQSESGFLVAVEHAVFCLQFEHECLNLIAVETQISMFLLFPEDTILNFAATHEFRITIEFLHLIFWSFFFFSFFFFLTFF